LYSSVPQTVAPLVSLLYHFAMPRVFVWNGYRFFFYSNEGDPLEPVHVHVRKAESVAKFWIQPEIRLASSWGFSSSELTALEKIVTERHSIIRKAWHEHFDR
jgi:hypothetical protein